jgi:aryl-alcohol dehydrogenase-like predicted oxidoreductase
MHDFSEKRPFGRTAHLSARTLFGAAALWSVSQEEADRTLDLLLEYGVNHIDTAASYGDSELRIGPWMEKHRDAFFLATKTDKRSYQEAYDEIQKSLERLRVDHVDLIQLHYLVDPDEWETAMGPDGALKAAFQARDEGLTRFIGVTGHDLAVASMHLRSLERFDFDSVLLPYNYVLMQNPQYAADFEALVEVCQERDVAVQAIKSLVRRPWGEREHTRTTWYQPLEEQEAVDRAVHWVLGRPGIFLNTPGDLHVLPKVLDAASRFEERPTDEQMEELVEQKGMEPLFV